MNMFKTIEMTYEQVDSIVLAELKDALERNIADYHDEVSVCDRRKEHRNLIKALHRSVAYFMAHDEFVEYMSDINWPSDIKRSQFKW